MGAIVCFAFDVALRLTKTIQYIGRHECRFLSLIHFAFRSTKERMYPPSDSTNESNDAKHRFSLPSCRFQRLPCPRGFGWEWLQKLLSSFESFHTHTSTPTCSLPSFVFSFCRFCSHARGIGVWQVVLLVVMG